jgi:hypothetical protein
LPALHNYGEATLLWDEVCVQQCVQSQRLSAGATLRDVCSTYICEVRAGDAPDIAAGRKHVPLVAKAPHTAEPHARAALVNDRAGSEYIIAANFDREIVTVDLPLGWRPALLAGDAKMQHGKLILPPASLTLCAYGV